MDDKEKIRQKLSLLFERELVDEIFALGPLVSVPEGQVLLDYGKKVSFMPIVINGNIKVLRKDEEGHEILLYYLGSSESCAMAYSCCMDAKVSEIKAIAEEDSELIKIPHEKLDEWLAKYPSWKSYVFNSFSQRFNELLKSLESVAFHKLDERLVSYLKTKSALNKKTSVQLSHAQIADELGTSRVVISRLLKQLENEKKLILYRSEIKLLQAFFA